MAAATWLDYGPIAIAALSLITSVVMGLRSQRFAKRALSISESQEARRQARLDLHLNDSVSCKNTDHGDRRLAFHLLVTNPTERSTSLCAAELHLTYSLGSVLTTVKVPSESDLPVPGIGTADVAAPLKLPLHLTGSTALSGWLVFNVPEGLTGGRPIERYDVVVRDIHGVVESIQVLVFRETTHGKSQKDHD